MSQEVHQFRGILESVNKQEREGKKPYLKIKAIPEGLEKARTYNYHAPWEFKEASMEEIAAHIEETKKGLLAVIDMEISFTYTEGENTNPKYPPWKNIQEFTVEFKTAGEEKVDVTEEHVKEAPRRPGKKVTKHPEGGKKPGEETTDPDKEKKIAGSHLDDVAKEVAAHRANRRMHQRDCLEDAEKAWTFWRYGETYNRDDLDSDDFRNIRAIANGFMAEDGRNGRC